LVTGSFGKGSVGDEAAEEDGSENDLGSEGGPRLPGVAVKGELCGGVEKCTVLCGVTGSGRLLGERRLGLSVESAAGGSSERCD
jgi:hypothetical protein